MRGGTISTGRSEPKAGRRAKFERTAKAELARRFGVRRRDNPAEDLDDLLGLLCEEWGFCTQLAGEDLLACSEPLTADAFALAVVVAERFELDSSLAWRERIAAVFRARYGETQSNPE